MAIINTTFIRASCKTVNENEMDSTLLFPCNEPLLEQNGAQVAVDMSDQHYNIPSVHDPEEE